MKENVHLEDLGVDMRIILKRIYNKCVVGACTGSIWFRVETVSYECGNEPSGFIKCRGFLD